MLKLLPSLETLSQQHSEEVIRELASGVGAVIATHGAYRPDGFAAVAQKTQTKRDDSAADSRLPSPPSPLNGPNPNVQSVNASAASEMGAKDGSRSSSSSGGSQPPTPTKAVADLLLEACDPDVPTKAVALRSLTRLIQTRHPDAVEAQEKIFMVGRLLIHFNAFLLIQVQEMHSREGEHLFFSSSLFPFPDKLHQPGCHCKKTL